MQNQEAGIDEKKVICFPSGIPGFEEYVEYTCHCRVDESGEFYWLQACANPDITLTLVAPNHYGLHYDFSLTDEEQALLEVEDAREIAILLVVTPQGPDLIGLSANITGPILINVAKQRGLQKVLQQSKMVATVVGD